MKIIFYVIKIIINAIYMITVELNKEAIRLRWP